MRNTDFLDLLLFDYPEDGIKKFKEFLTATSGFTNSNMIKLDDAISAFNATIEAMKGTGYTNESIRNNYELIQQLQSGTFRTIHPIEKNNWTAIIDDITEIPPDGIFKVAPTQINDSTVTLSINGEVPKDVLKYVPTESGGTTEYVLQAIDPLDFRNGNQYFITKSTDGQKYIVLSLSPIWGNQVFVTGMSPDIVFTLQDFVMGMFFEIEPNSILQKVLTVDGDGSGLDADLVGGAPNAEIAKTYAGNLGIFPNGWNYIGDSSFGDYRYRKYLPYTGMTADWTVELFPDIPTKEICEELGMDYVESDVDGYYIYSKEDPSIYQSPYKFYYRHITNDKRGV